MAEKSTVPKVIRGANIFLDQIIPPLRGLLFPFKWLTRLWDGLQQLCWYFSNEYTKRSLGSCGSGVRIYGRFRVKSPQNLYLGDNVHINTNAFLQAEGSIKIGDHTHISRNLVIYTANHNYEGTRLPYDESKVLKPVVIGRNVWIGMNVIITPGVTIGDGAILGMGTVVTQDVPPLAVIGNQPTRLLKARDAEHYQALDQDGAYGGMYGHEWQPPR